MIFPDGSGCPINCSGGCPHCSPEDHYQECRQQFYESLTCCCDRLNDALGASVDQTRGGMEWDDLCKVCAEEAREEDPAGAVCGFCGNKNDFASDQGWFYPAPDKAACEVCYWKIREYRVLR